MDGSVAPAVIQQWPLHFLTVSHGLLYSTRTDITHFAVPQNKANIKFILISNYVH